jgi:hypothetical protein
VGTFASTAKHGVAFLILASHCSLGDRDKGRSLLLPDIELAEIGEMPVLQGFLTISAAGSLFFSKITLILAV